MTHPALGLGLLAALLALATSPTLAHPAGPTTGPAASAPAMGRAAMGTGSGQMHGAMMSGMQAMQRMPMSGDTDKDFAAMMRVHHQQAVEMARVQLQHGKDPELRAMAQKIIDDQQREIAQFDRWLATRK